MKKTDFYEFDKTIMMPVKKSRCVQIVAYWEGKGREHKAKDRFEKKNCTEYNTRRSTRLRKRLKNPKTVNVWNTDWTFKLFKWSFALS